MPSLQFLKVLLSGILLHSASSHRTWQTDLSYSNPHNWGLGRIPCPADRVIFHNKESLVLELPEGSTAIRELILAESIELILPKDGGVSLTGIKTSSSCEGKDTVFKHVEPLRWLDPSNWDRWSKATPDLEKVPCASEAVRFPVGATFNIIVPEVVKLGRLEINGVVMDSFDWEEYSANEESVRQLHKADGDSPVIEVSGNPCPRLKWCECGNEYLHTSICKSACKLALCKEPVKPSGFCCPLCGAYFLLKSKSEEKPKLKQHIKLFLENKGVEWHASKVKDSIQVVLVEDGEYQGKISEVAEDLKISIINSGLGWIVEEFHASGHVWYPITFMQVVGHFLSLLVLAVTVLAIIIVFYSKDWAWLRFSPLEGRPFVFARFENQSGEVLVSHEARESIPDAPSQAFDNPMYGATGQEHRNVTVENPIYTELEETSADSNETSESNI